MTDKFTVSPCRNHPPEPEKFYPTRVNSQIPSDENLPEPKHAVLNREVWVKPSYLLHMERFTL